MESSPPVEKGYPNHFVTGQPFHRPDQSFVIPSGRAADGLAGAVLQWHVARALREGPWYAHGSRAAAAYNLGVSRGRLDHFFNGIRWIDAPLLGWLLARYTEVATIDLDAVGQQINAIWRAHGSPRRAGRPAVAPSQGADGMRFEGIFTILDMLDAEEEATAASAPSARHDVTESLPSDFALAERYLMRSLLAQSDRFLRLWNVGMPTIEADFRWADPPLDQLWAQGQCIGPDEEEAALIVASVALPTDWERAVMPHAWAVLDDAFIVRVDKIDEVGNPSEVVAVVVDPYGDPGEGAAVDVEGWYAPVIRSVHARVSWTEGKPTLHKPRLESSQWGQEDGAARQLD